MGERKGSPKKTPPLHLVRGFSPQTCTSALFFQKQGSPPPRLGCAEKKSPINTTLPRRHNWGPPPPSPSKTLEPSGKKITNFEAKSDRTDRFRRVSKGRPKAFKRVLNLHALRPFEKRDDFDYSHFQRQNRRLVCSEKPQIRPPFVKMDKNPNTGQPKEDTSPVYDSQGKKGGHTSLKDEEKKTQI